MLARKSEEIKLYQACEIGDTQRVLNLIKLGANVNSSETGTNPLYAATYNGHANTVLALLENGALVDQVNMGMTALHCATARGHDNIISILAQYGAFIDKQTGMKKSPTALFLAITGRKTKAALKLIELGANINLANDEGETPLMIAVQKQSHDIIAALLKAGADTTIKKNNKTAEMFYEDKKTLALFKAHKDRVKNSHAYIDEQLKSIQNLIKTQLKDDNNDPENKQKYFDILVETITALIRFIQDNLDQANDLNGLPSMLFEVANLLNALNHEKNEILEKAISVNREVAAELHHPDAVRIMKNFKPSTVSLTVPSEQTEGKHTQLKV